MPETSENRLLSAHNCTTQYIPWTVHICNNSGEGFVVILSPLLNIYIWNTYSNCQSSTGTSTITWLAEYHWSNLEGCGTNRWVTNHNKVETTNHNKTRTVCKFPGYTWTKSLSSKLVVLKTSKLNSTHLSLDKMAVISQTIFSDAFSWAEPFFIYIVIKISLKFVPKEPIEITQHWFR